MKTDQLFDTDVREPEPEPSETSTAVAVLDPEPRPPAASGISGILPEDFPLRTLLAFLPDVRLKHELQSLAKQALSVDVTAEGGLARADDLRGRIGDKVREICGLFDGTDLNPGPTRLAHMLHKRLTGLRVDFTDDGVKAEETVGKSIVAETARLKQVAERERLEAQERADRAAKVTADLAAKEAREAGAPPAVVNELKRQAATAVAPPVASAAPPTLARTTTAELWRGRLVGCKLEDPQPDNLADLPPADQATARKFFRAVSDGKIPLAAARIEWGFIDRRAQAEKTSLVMPHIETYNQGSPRRKGKR